jgi:tRNA (mo5U34)-methyltransferase
MLTIPPANFSVSELFEGIYTYQRWEIFPGIFTKGPSDVAERTRQFGIPQNLTGARVLDIAPWNGFYSFECVRRGAKEVLSLGPDDPDVTGYNKVRDLLSIDNVKYVRGSVYDLSPEHHGSFDVVLCLGVLYHLRYPLLALDKVYDVALHHLYIDSPIIDNQVYDRTVSPDAKKKILTEGRVVHEIPLVYFTKSNETGDFFNWFMPNLRAFHDFVESSGFKIINQKVTGDWAYIAAEKAERRFNFGIEGMNPNVAKFAPNNT